MADLEGLVSRATSGRLPDRRRHFRPSMLFSLLKSPFNLWCDYHAPPSARVDETTRYERFRMDLGAAYEAEWVRDHCPEAVEIPKTYDLPALSSTFQAMLRGDREIHSPQLWLLSEEMYGMGDLLRRHDDHPSDLGPFHYRLTEIKRSKKVDASPASDDYRVLQAMTYHRILGRLQGYAPPSFTIVLRQGQVEASAEGRDGRLDGALALWKSIRDNTLRPELPAHGEGDSPWRSFAEQILERSGDSTLAPGIGRGSRKKLREKIGVRTAERVERLSLGELKEALGDLPGTRVFYRLEARRQGRPVLAPGARLDIPRRKRHLYFDFETCDDLHPTIRPHVYMIGLYDLERRDYRVFTTRGPQDEERIFREFIAYADPLEDTCLYHWHSFETETLRSQVIPRHPAFAGDLERVLGSCVDLKEALKDRVYFPTRTYSIKEVAPTVGFHWKQEDVDAFESMMLYWDFVNDEDEGKIAKIVQYNRDDCEAMLAVENAARAARPAAGGP